MRPTGWSDIHDWVGRIGYAGTFHIEIHNWKIPPIVNEYIGTEWVSGEEANSIHDSAGDIRDMPAQCSISKAV